MPDKSQYAFKFATKGIVSSLDPLLLSDQTLSRMTNGRLHKQLPRTRFKFREIPITGNTETLEEWRGIATQGAAFYNPAKGQGALTFGKDQSQIMEASGGRKFTLEILSRSSQTCARLVEKTNSIEHNPYVHLVWWNQAENYMLCCDGGSQLWIWDGRNDATASTGLDGVNKEGSKLPNACTVILYVHYRVMTVTDARRIYVGDALHKSNLSSSANLLNATEAVYFNTGQWFSPPSNMGNILAGAVLPTRNTQHGHSEAVFHCEDGVFSVQTNLPREQWSTSAITRHMLLKTGAVGPYALDLMDGDQVFRSRHGIQTLRSAAAETTTILNPFAPLSGEIADMFAGDTPEFLRFTTLVNFTRSHRLFCSVYPMVALRHRWSRGFVVLNLNPTDVVPEGTRSWEGLWTLPERWGGIVQFVNGLFVGEERTFALCWNQTTRRKTLIEITMVEGDDEMDDGSHSRISCQAWTKALFNGELFDTKHVSAGCLFLKDVKGVLDYGVWYRGDGVGEWRRWYVGQVCVDHTDNRTLTGKGGKDFAVPLGPIPPPDVNTEFRYIQFMVRWRGVASLETLDVMMDKPKGQDNLQPRPQTECQDGTLSLCSYSDFEYTSSDRWETEENNSNAINSQFC